MRVLMIGPGLSVRGGVSSVERLIVEVGGANGLAVFQLSSYEDGGLFTKLLAFVRCLVVLPFRLGFGRYSLVHIHFSHYGSTFRKLIIFHLVRLFQKPVVMHSHGSDFHIFYEELPGFFKRFVRYSLLRADQVIALSESWKKFFVEEVGLGPGQVFVMQNPVQIMGNSAVKKTAIVQYLFLGRLERRKGIYDIVDALSLLKARDSLGVCHVVAAGDGDVELVSALVRERELSEFVTLKGWVGREDVVELLMQSHVLLLPSYNEGLPMALLEAMACGLTVVTTPVGGIPEVVEHQKNGLLIEPGDVDSLAKAIVLSQDPTARERLSKNAVESMQSNSIDAYCSTLFTNYRALNSREFHLGEEGLEAGSIDSLEVELPENDSKDSRNGG